ncbi:MAG: hypothetical protein K2J68_11315 [Treponemataceae bacterium]|nr:hypothetical protein [Treponemataceae bacterium]
MKKNLIRTVLKGVLPLTLALVFMTPCFAQDNENWTEWNITCFDWSKESNKGLVKLVNEKIDWLEKARGMQGTNNPLVRDSGLDALYSLSLKLWSDYLKFSLCNAEGLKFIPKDEIEIYDEIFPTLHKFAIDYYAGVYTNGIDPDDFSFVPRNLKRCQKAVATSLGNMAMHFNIQKYLDEPYKIPSLAKKLHGGSPIKVILVILVLCAIAAFVVLVVGKKIKICNFIKSKEINHGNE